MSKGNSKIVIIIPYFGKWPPWIGLYFYSCSLNYNVDFYFFTDCKCCNEEYKNLHFVNCSFNQYCDKVSKKLNINFHPTQAYKLCDIKPFLGYIHSDIIHGNNYTFWGTGDVDLVFGNIATFYNERVLLKYDVFSTHYDRISGHLMILRASKKYIELCLQIKDWKSKLEDESHWGLDETDFSYLLYPESRFIRKSLNKFVKIFKIRNDWRFRLFFLPFINFCLLLKLRGLYFVEQHTTPYISNIKISKHIADKWYFNNGIITNDLNGDRIYIYLHFLFYKRNKYSNFQYWGDDCYRISESDFKKTIIIDTSGIHI